MLRTTAWSGTGKRPIFGRFLAALLIVIASRSSGADLTAAPLTESEAVALGLSRPSLQEITTGELDLARSDAIEAGLLPNPLAAYTREQTFGGSDASGEDYAWVVQKFDLSGRRRLRVQAAERRLEATEDQARSRRLQIGAALKTRFYDVLQRQRRVDAIRQWSTRLETARDRISRRAAAGEAAQYDRRRAEREHAAALARLAVEDAGLNRAREHLAALLTEEPPPPSSPIVIGELLPREPLPLLEDALERLMERPDLRALEATADAADLQGRASARWWLPEIEIGGGFKSVELADKRLNGFIASGAIPLPFFDRNQDDAMRAAAEAQVARGQRRLELTEAAGEMRGVHAQAARLVDAARSARSVGTQEWVALTQTAEAAYDGGEGGILELVDAYRAQLAGELQTLELEWRARRARIELDRLIGEGPQ
jgi:cobalt-zinc-cadmium efflux system outer membrane protein